MGEFLLKFYEYAINFYYNISMEIYYIYTLEDPRNNNIRYIGYTKKLLKDRLIMHLKNLHEAKQGKRNWNKRISWLESLAKVDVIPVIKELEHFSIKEDALNSEIYWIEQFKIWGFNLTNMTLGGDGGDTFSSQTLEKQIKIKQKISKKNKGRIKSKETIEKFKKSIKASGHFSQKPGFVHPMLGKPVSQETRLKISKAKIGKKLSKEHKKKLCGRIPPNKNISKHSSIIQYSLDMVKLNEFETAGIAIIHLNLPTHRQSEIIRCCKEITKKALGFKWKFKING